MTAFTDAVVNIRSEELASFHNGELKETDQAVFQRVGDYWNKLAEQPDFEVWKGYNGRSDCKFDANGKLIENSKQPWSAAFISFVAAMAGAGADFRYGPSHSVYIVNALREAKNAFSTAKFVARRHTEYVPKIGDLIACERRKDTDATFDSYIDFVNAGRFEAHCDFVAGFDAQNKECDRHWRQRRQQRLGKDLAAGWTRAHRKPGSKVFDRQGHLHHRVPAVARTASKRGSVR